MDDLCVFWAKLANQPYENRHPVVCHSADVAFVAHCLWTHVLRDATRQRIAAHLGFSVDDAGRWIAFWAGSHDIGKISPGFQAKEKSGFAKKALCDLGFKFPPGKGVPHGTISTAVLSTMLQTFGTTPPGLARRVAVAVGGHHGVFPQTRDYDGLSSAILGNDQWDAARGETLAALAKALKVPTDAAPREPPPTEHAFFLFLAGLTSVADWIGSNQEFFPSAGGKVVLDDYYRSAPDRAHRALDRLGWLGWKPDRTLPASFHELFPDISSSRPLQIKAVELAPQLEDPALVLIEAPMGEGKTEAALYLADRWTHACGQQGLYFALPTQATSNQMFDRVTAFLKRRYPNDFVNQHLLHGHALLSDAYNEMLRLAEIHDESDQGAVVAEGWFAQSKKRGLLAPFAVGTVDQALLAVLQTRHVFVRLFGLAGKTIVLDEVHAYDAYMSVLLERLLKWLAALGCSVVLLSATLPKAKRNGLLTAYAGAAPTVSDVPYPRILIARPGRVEAIALSTDPERHRVVSLEWHDPSRLADDLDTALGSGGCAAVICNTVGRAQKVYQCLRDALKPKDIEVHLFHARFPFGRRDEIEKEVLVRYGPPEKSPNRPHKAVLVATQVIEQSLDLDFDLMISEMAPIDLILQRLGRLFRHVRPRPADLGTPRLWLFRPDNADGQGPPQFGLSEKIYDRYILLRSYLALRGCTGIRLPNDVELLVEQVYGRDELPSAWPEELNAARQQREDFHKDDSEAAHHCLIGDPHDEDDLLERFCQQLEEDDPEVHNSHQALTRLTEPSITLVLLYDREGQTFLNPDGTGPIDLKHRPTLAEAKKLLRSAVTITHCGIVFHFAKQKPPPGWSKCGLLRFHRAVCLDTNGRAEVDSQTIRYDDNVGVTIEATSP